MVTAAGALAAPVALSGTAQAGMPEHVRAAVVDCESGGRNVEHGGDPGGVSTASGAYQFVNGTWRHFGGTEFAPRAIGATRAEQDIVADRAFDANGLRDWAASQSCWGPKIGRGAVQDVADVAPAPVRDTAPARMVGGTHVVRAGDTLGEIAAAHGTTWQKLFAANCGTIDDPDRIFPGERIHL